MKTPQTFYKKYDGVSLDFDKSYGVQCVDSFKICCDYLGIPVKATPNNWADGYWIYRDQLEFYKYFDYIYDVKDLKQGDWCIWSQGSSCVKSHIAMYWKGVNGTHAQFFGENQDGKRYFCLANVKTDILGALRPKMWGDGMNQGKLKGCDVSQWNDLNTDISQFDYVIIRATWGTNLDNKANDWRLKCERLGIPYGVYCYSYALDVTGATEEAEFICNVIKGWNIQMGVWIDMEDSDNYKAKHNALNSVLCTAVCQVFCQKVQEKGYYTGIYASESWFGTYIKGCDEFDKWVASWGTNDGTIQRDTEHMGTMLQYTSHGGLDKDISYCEVSHYKSYPVYQNEPITEPSEPIEELVIENPSEDEKPSNNGSSEVIEMPKDDYLFKMSNRAYDLLKFITHIIPILLTFYVAISKIWGLPLTESIVASITAFDSMLITIMNMSTIGYQKKGGNDG